MICAAAGLSPDEYISLKAIFLFPVFARILVQNVVYVTHTDWTMRSQRALVMTLAVVNHFTQVVCMRCVQVRDTINRA